MRWLALVGLLGACRAAAPTEDTSRSSGLAPAALSIPQQVAVWNSATRAGFDMSPDLHLLAHPRHLPRGAGLNGGIPLADDLSAALERAGLIEGLCEPVAGGRERAPTCRATRSGYVIRSTEIFQAGGDTLRMNMRADLFAVADGPGQDAFAFEMAYKLVPRDGGGWRVAAEGRVREKQ